MMREIQREFDKHPISVPVQADTPAAFGVGTTVYNGPVVNVHGDRAQIAWGNRDVSQNQEHQQEIAPGYEAIAKALASTLEHLADAGLSNDDRAMAEDAAKEALGEVIKDEPNLGLIRRLVAVVKGVLAPLAVGVKTGASDGAKEWAKTAVEQITSALPAP
jgi:hypothetical protein